MSDANPRLLVVEDDPGLQSQLRWCFENYEVLVAEDRESALAELRRHEPPVVHPSTGILSFTRARQRLRADRSPSGVMALESRRWRSHDTRAVRPWFREH